MEVKNNEGDVLYHIQVLADWHEPVDMFVFMDHEPSEHEIRRCIREELALDESDSETTDDLAECAKAYHVYTVTP